MDRKQNERPQDGEQVRKKRH